MNHNLKKGGQMKMRKYGFSIIVLLSLLLAATGAMAVATIESPTPNQEICGLTGFNVSAANMTTGLDPVLLTCLVGSTVVINATNGTGFANITLPDMSTTTWVATPSDIEGGTLNCTAYGAGYLANKLNLVSALEEGDSNTVSIDNTAPTFTFTPADNTVLSEGTQVITATSVDKLSGYGFTFDGNGRAVTLAADSYSFTYTVDSADYSDAIFPYTATGSDNSSCSNSRASAVKYLEIDTRGAVTGQIVAKAEADKAADKDMSGKSILMIIVLLLAAYFVFVHNKK